MPTGFRSVDGVLSGLQQTDFVVIAARPAMGKTAFAINIAQNIARRGKSVGIISLEMSKSNLLNACSAQCSALILGKCEPVNCQTKILRE